MMKSILKKRPVILLLVVGVLFFYSIINYKQQVNYLRDNYAKTILYKERRMVAMISLSRMLGSQEMFDELHSQLEDARENEMIDFYILQYKGKALWFGSYDGDITQLDRHYEIVDQPMIAEHATFETLALAPDYKLTLGFGKDPDAYVERNMVRFRAGLWTDAIYYVGIVAFVAMWAFWDLFKILGKVRSGKGSEVASIRTTSREAELFARGFQGYADSLHDMTERKNILDRQVLPSLRGELRSGLKPPYDFNCTLVRTDINGYTALYYSEHKQHLMATINEFFHEVSHIVSRYNGCIHEFVGDEVLFYFKDDVCENSFASALAAIRDVEEAARAIDAKVKSEPGYAFTIKSSLAHGPLTFGPLLNGFSLSGGILIETVRVLSQVTEKDGNVVYFDSSHLPRVNNLFKANEAVRVNLKGLQGERTLFRVDSKSALTAVIAGLTPQTVSMVQYFRSDNDLHELVSHLASRSVDDPFIPSAVTELRKVPITRFDGKLVNAFTAWLDDLERACTLNLQGPWKNFSSVVSLIPNLIPQDQLPSEMRDRLERYTMLKDERTVANALEVMALFNATDENGYGQKQQRHENNRIAANALVLEGRNRLSPKFVKKLRRELKSSDETRVASAIYALGDVAAFHKTRDFVFFSTQIELHELLSDLPRWAQSQNEQVRNQALRALSKIEGVDQPSRRHSA